MILPQTNEVCPACGSRERITETIIQDMIKDGKLPLGFSSSLQMSVPLADTTKPPIILTGNKISIPMLVIKFDVCKTCKSFYATKIEILNKEMGVR
jgi:hypothetical protein